MQFQDYPLPGKYGVEKGGLLIKQMLIKVQQRSEKVKFLKKIKIENS
jgi:hypothetical protein